MGLLKGVPPLLTADLLYILRSMGHGDKLCICDCNFPASEVATKTTSGEKIELACDLPTAIDAICQLLPLDFFVDAPAMHMAPQAGVALPTLGKEVIDASKAAIQRHAEGIKVEPCERFDFYEEARSCFAVVQCLERRPYGNVVLTKGVVGPDGKDLKPEPAGSELPAKQPHGRPSEGKEPEPAGSEPPAKKPRGRPPKGKTWNDNTGEYE